MSHYSNPSLVLAMPFQFWSLVFFTFGCIVGSFLNVCIHRMPRGESIVSPPSHCPHCKYSIPWYLNIPLFTWIYLRGQCANCRAPISMRYFLVELLTGVIFFLAWVVAGPTSVWLSVAYCVLFSGLIAATFIDFEHFIIPDEITIGGIVVGLVFSLLVPPLHGVMTRPASLLQSVLGAGIGAGVVYAILRVGKVLFGRRQIDLAPDTKIIFTETGLVLPKEEIPFEEIFYRKTDTIILQAKTVELVDRCYWDVEIRLTPERLTIGNDTFDPEAVLYMEVVTDKVVLPREAMGLGDVKFMAAIGAFLGWQATLFSLMLSSVIGSVVGLSLIALKRQEWSSRLPYGPYIAIGAVAWIFGGQRLVQWWLNGGFLLR